MGVGVVACTARLSFSLGGGGGGARNSPPSETVQRFKFHSHCRRQGESVAIYISELQALAEFCNLGEQTPFRTKTHLREGSGDCPKPGDCCTSQGVEEQPPAGSQCGQEGHLANKCTFVNAECHKCGKTLSTGMQEPA